MDKKIHTDNSEIFETEDIDEVSGIIETEDIDETEPEETDQTDVPETDEVPAKKRFWRKDNILKIIVAVLAVLIICEYTFFGVFFQTNKAKYEKAKQETQQEESSTEEKKVNIVTEEPLPTTNINDDSENEEEIEVTSEYNTYDSHTSYSTETSTTYEVTTAAGTEDELPVVTTEEQKPIVMICFFVLLATRLSNLGKPVNLTSLSV